MMKKIFFTTILISFLLASCVGFSVSDDSELEISLLSQDPYPANPGEYVDLVFKVENTGGEPAKDVKFTLEDSFPFTVDSEANRIKSFNSIESGEDDYMLVKYTIKTDENALDKEYNIRLKCNYKELMDSTIVKEFTIDVGESRTEFYTIIQDIDETVSIAILNTGKKDAESVVVRIPKQDNFDVTGPNENVIGTLESGDYTIVSFDMFKKTEVKDLTIEIDYTDIVGERRESSKIVELDLVETEEETGTEFFNTTTIIVTIVIVVIIVWIVRKKWRRRRENKRSL